jgi:hypothetical protein
MMHIVGSQNMQGFGIRMMLAPEAIGKFGRDMPLSCNIIYDEGHYVTAGDSVDNATDEDDEDDDTQTSPTTTKSEEEQFRQRQICNKQARVCFEQKFLDASINSQTQNIASCYLGCNPSCRASNSAIVSQSIEPDGYTKIIYGLRVNSTNYCPIETKLTLDMILDYKDKKECYKNCELVHAGQLDGHLICDRPGCYETDIGIEPDIIKSSRRCPLDWEDIVDVYSWGICDCGLSGIGNDGTCNRYAD